jgi:hypothetical protein
MRRRSIMSNNTLRTCVVAVVTVLLGVLAGGATAGIRPDDRSGVRGGTLLAQSSYPDAVDRAVANHLTHVLRPDDRAGVRGGGRGVEVSYPDAVDRAVANHRHDLVQSTQSARVSQSGGGFDWGAAGVGASTMSALLLIAGCGLALARRKRRLLGSV